METSNATGIATAPTLRESPKFTSSFSLRSAVSQRIVANDPVTERFGPSSTPIGTALAIGAAYGFIATGLILVGFVIKLEVEEARMRDTFPQYANYSRHTARLIPGVF